MAFVKDLELSNGREVRLQPTQVTCFYKVGEVSSGKRLIQLTTNGSELRQKPGKTSQTLQFDEARARQLWTLLGKEFGFSA